MDFLPNHDAARKFPVSMEELRNYDVVILSDIGSNTLLLHPDTFSRSIPMADRCALLAEYVRQGGGLIMVGGYMSFSGIDGKARYRQTVLREVLPVTMVERDDRVECPQGFSVAWWAQIPSGSFSWRTFAVLGWSSVRRLRRPRIRQPA